MRAHVVAAGERTTLVGGRRQQRRCRRRMELRRRSLLRTRTGEITRAAPSCRSPRHRTESGSSSTRCGTCSASTGSSHRGRTIVTTTGRQQTDYEKHRGTCCEMQLASHVNHLENPNKVQLRRKHLRPRDQCTNQRAFACARALGPPSYDGELPMNAAPIGRGQVIPSAIA
jgi:hypothetical protein